MACDCPALLALVGQTPLAQPAVVLPTVVARLRRVPDAELRGRLCTALMVRMPAQEMLAMTARLLEEDALLLDTPFLHRIREAGRLEGALSARRRSILEAVALRFAPPTALPQHLEQHLEALTDAARLERLSAAAIQSASLADFQATLANERQD